jgi:hypothetical protein
MTTRPLGVMRTADNVITVDFQVDGSAAHASGDLLAQPVRLEGAGFTDVGGYIATLLSVTVIDPDDQGQNLTVVFASSDPVSCGTLNAAPTLSDALALNAAGIAQVTTWEDCGGFRVGSEIGIGLTMATDDAGDLWAWLLSKGTGTYAGGKLRVKFGFLRH